MNPDLSNILHDWPYESGQINVRLVRGNDGEPKIQVRLDLGILQMNTEGRPDGLRPNRCESLLDYYERVLDGSIRLPDPSEQPDDLASDQDHDQANDQIGESEQPEDGITDIGDELDTDSDLHDPAGGSPRDPADSPVGSLNLSSEQCKLLRDEAAQYYHRYVALLVLEDFEGVIRDTSRNLRVADLCADHAEAEEDRRVLEQVRPYIMMMRARALASLSIRENESNAAVLAIETGLESIQDFYTQLGEPEQFEQSSEAQVLRSMREALLPKLPVSQKAELRERLREALASENYELAAILRDELRLLDR